MTATDALIERKRTLSTQLRRIDESVDHYVAGKAEPSDLIVTGDDQEGDTLDIEINGEWHSVPAAEELTRAGLYEADVGLEAAGLLPSP